MKRLVGIMASWLLVLALCYIPLEMTVLRWLPQVFPVASVMNYLDPDVQLLAQYSKKKPVPENYIAILGDSYAFGQGDWLYNRQHEIAPDYNTTHILHEKTGRDVVSFGRPASSNIKGYLEDPLVQLRCLRGRFPVKDPAIALLYFYEGNDVVDNWKEFEVRYQKQGYDPARLQDEQYFARFIDAGILGKNITCNHPAGFFDAHYFLFGRFLVNLMGGETLRLYADLQQRVAAKPHRPIFKPQPRDHNTVLVADAEQKIPDGLQVPPLMLHDDEKAVAMTILDQSLRQLEKRWPDTKLAMIYVPAVSTAYDVVSDTVNIYDTERGKNYAAGRLLPESDETCQRVQAIASANGIPFVDARPAVRAAAKQQFLHGPVDWLHFNEAGYRVLAGEIGKLLELSDAGMPGSGCTQLSP